MGRAITVLFFLLAVAALLWFALVLFPQLSNMM